MPYMLSKDGKCVHKKNVDGSMGARVKCHEDGAHAKKHMKALSANVTAKGKTAETIGEKVYRPFNQQETAYTTLHTNPAQACANCRFFKVDTWDGTTRCHLVEDWPEPILATGYCNEWRASQPAAEPEPLAVAIVGEYESMEEFAEVIGAMTAPQKQAVGGLIEGLAKFLRRDPPADPLDNLGFKISDDDQRWEAFYSNNWRDNDGELFPEAAIDRFIQRVKTGVVPYPELQYAHLSGLAHGVADNLMRIGHHVYATGTFDDTELAAKLRAHGRKCQKEGRKIGLSHRFWFNPQQRTPSGEYADFETFEITWFEILPDVQPANTLTVWETKSMNSNIPESLVKNLELIVGKDRAKSLIDLSVQLDAQAIAERRDAKTANTPQSMVGAPTPTIPQVPESTPVQSPAADNVGGKLDQLLTQMTALDQKVTNQNTAVAQRLTAVEADIAGLKGQAAARNELAPPGSKSAAQRLNAEDRVGEYLGQQEKKSAQGQSLIDFLMGGVDSDGVPTEVSHQ